MELQTPVTGRGGKALLGCNQPIPGQLTMLSSRQAQLVGWFLNCLGRQNPRESLTPEQSKQAIVMYSARNPHSSERRWLEREAGRAQAGSHTYSTFMLKQWGPWCRQEASTVLLQRTRKRKTTVCPWAGLGSL